jgi:5-methylcytosine-specific restriction protein B
MFTWIPIHREAIHRILELRQNQKELLTILGEMEQQGLKVISLQDEGADGQIIPLAEIDPFTFLASFNRGVTDKNRRENWGFLKTRWGLKALVPDDFTGIPVLHNLTSRLFPFAVEREKDHVAHLWQVAALAADSGIEIVDQESFNRCLKLKMVRIGSLTIGLFWINPEKFLPADQKTTAYGKAKGITTEPRDYQSYRQWLKEMTELVGNNYPQVSHDAHLFATQNQSKLDLTPARMQTLWGRFRKVIQGFTDFQNPGDYFVDNETGYKRAVLKKFQQELGAEKLSALVAQGQGTKAAKEIMRVLTANLVSFHAWNVTLGETDQATCDVVLECLKATSSPYQGPDNMSDLFDACSRHNLKPKWDALTVLLWALRPQDFFPVKISFYRKLSTELGHELPSGRPDADKLHSLIEFGRAFWKALEPQKPSDWVDVQSFIWCVCPGNYEGADSESGSQGKGWKFTKWMVPVVDALRALGGSGTPKAVLQKIQELLTLPESVLTEKMGSGQSRFYNEVAWARKYLVWEGLVESPERGIWALTAKAKTVILDEREAQKIAERWAERHKQEAEAGEADNFQPPDGSTGEDAGLHESTVKPSPVVVVPPRSTGIAYWWLNANPKIWNFEDTPVGEKQTYTSHNEKGNKRQKYRYFEEAKPGDLVVGYVTSPQKEVVAVCKITKGLHQTENGEEIEFEKVEQFAKPIAYEALQANPDLANSEPLINNQGSLFKLTEQEYEIIRSLIDDTNITVTTEIESYDRKKAMKGLFLAETQFDEMLAALKEKKNVVLQGAPGVGKTYVAKRLAYALIESNDPLRIEVIQFHQSYSYEDFIQGFRPTPKGHFDLKYGIFHQFCRRAQREETQGRPYVFIIDEINRGNLSKIFGELMMLIEPDKRGKAHAIPLAYSQDADEKFYIPVNLHLIGMMNTADRSLAMVDYALRRRFRFINLRPEFSSEVFRAFLADAGARPELVKKIVARMNALNEIIAADTKNLGPGYQIGHSYFCPRNEIKPDEDWYRRVIESEIVPLIQEYWFDNEQKVKEQRLALLA